MSLGNQKTYFYNLSIFTKKVKLYTLCIYMICILDELQAIISFLKIDKHFAL